jgi:hypothetical protein
MPLLSALTFGNPLALWALISLPGIWLLLKIYPPVPKIIFFPAIRFLKNLDNKQETASKSPLWLLIFRILLVTILVLAFSNPIYNAKPDFANKGPLLLIIDNGWSSSLNWEKRKDQLVELIEKAGQEKLPIIIAPTAIKNNIANNELLILNSKEAKSVIESLTPNPWPSNYSLLIKKLDKLSKNKNYNIVWLWDGIDHENGDSSQILVSKLENLGRLNVINYFNNSSIKIITAIKNKTNNKLNIQISRDIGSLAEIIFVRANGANGQLLNRIQLSFKENERIAETELLIPRELRKELMSITIENVSNAGSVHLFDEKWRKRTVGIYGDKESFRTQPLLSPAYYLDRAIKSFSDVQIGNLEKLIKKETSVIILPGVGTIREELNIKLKDWIKNGGILIRFAGPNLEAANTDLLPVKLRSMNSRAFGGALSWSTPATIKEFPINSPLNGIEINDDIIINKQVIAEPSAELANKTWASLKDGTPLITGNNNQKGWNVFFHITANADWSNLPLTGTFVEILDRIINLSSGAEENINDLPLTPYKLLDGFGRLTEPSSEALPTNFSVKDLTPSSGHAPGFYGNKLYMRALNLGENIKNLSPQIITFQKNTVFEKFESENTINLKIFLLIILLFLVFIDYFISLNIRGKIKLTKIINIYKFCFLLFGFYFSFNIAIIEAADKASALQTHLAYIVTKNQKINDTTQLGLLELTRVLRERTSIEAGPPIAINLSKDDISFYPIIYWPITQETNILSNTIINKIQLYMKNGGLIVFDTRDQSPTNTISKTNSKEQEALKNILKSLDLPILIQVPNNHVLRRSFYLLDELPGRFTGGNIWVEATAKNSKDGVSSVLIGGNDWASAWAKNSNSKPIYSVIPGGEKQREFSYRFGINLVMYAMTGNYKADQVHIKSILKRLNTKSNIEKVIE